MRIFQSCTRRASLILTLGAISIAAAGRSALRAEAAFSDAGTAAQQRADENGARLAGIDVELAAAHWAAALAGTQEYEGQCGPAPAVDFRAAQAWFGLGQVLGTPAIRQIPDGRVGQFAGEYLLVEERAPGRYLCCTRDSALFRLRRALDGGFDEPAAHLLHARIWQALGKPEVALALAKSREAVILADPQAGDLNTLAAIALQANAPDDYLRYVRRRADREPRRHDEILAAAYLALTDYYAQRGDHDLEREFCYRAARLQPEDPKLALRLGDAEWSAQRYEPATRLYRQYLQRGPAQDADRARVLERLATAPADTAAP